MKGTKHICSLKNFAFLLSYINLAASSMDLLLKEADLVKQSNEDDTRILSSKKSSKKSGKGKKHRRCLMQADFNTNGVTGYIKAQYVGQEAVDFDVHIDLGKFQPDGQTISNGSEMAWHLHTNWKNNGIYSGANDQCLGSMTGNHYDPTVACGPASEWVNSNGICYGPKGQKKDSTKYSCSSTSNWPTTCERGDVSTKIGKFVVNSNHEINFKAEIHFLQPSQRLIMKEIIGELYFIMVLVLQGFFVQK